jgi:hypothetical protein
MTDYERGYEQGKADATSKMHPEIRKCLEDYFDKCFTEYKEDRRQWVGLTNDEIKSLPSWWPSYEDAPALVQLVKDVETKLREKNGG